MDLVLSVSLYAAQTPLGSESLIMTKGNDGLASYNGQQEQWKNQTQDPYAVVSEQNIDPNGGGVSTSKNVGSTMSLFNILTGSQLRQQKDVQARSGAQVMFWFAWAIAIFYLVMHGWAILKLTGYIFRRDVT